MNPAQELMEQIRSGVAPQNIREFAAQGLLPYSQEDMIPIQILLLSDSVPKIVEMTSGTLKNVTEDQWSRLVERKDPDPGVLNYILRYRKSEVEVKEKILLNHTVPDSVFRAMASSETGRLIDVILNNHVRLLRDSEILSSLERNPALSADQKRRIEEFKTEFIYKKQKVEEGEIPLMPLEDLLAQIPNLDQEAQKWILEIDQMQEERPTDEQVQQAMADMFSREELNELPSEIISTYQRILKMTNGEKVRVAMLGNKEERAFLIRDTSRQVASLVLRNPKLTESEMDGFSQMRNVDSDLLRQMGQSRAFVKRYPVIHNLVKNPKTPSPIALNLLKLLRDADLRNLEKDKNIPDVIRRQAKKLREMKELKKG